MSNKALDMQIGICNMDGKPALYIQEGNVREIYAKFTTSGKAKIFMQKLNQWDENGWSDEKCN